MKNQDKIIAIGGIILIILLAAVAIMLLLRTDGHVGGVEPQETVELADEVEMEEEPLKAADVEESKEEVVELDETATETSPAVANTEKVELPEFYTRSECKKIKNDDPQMKELYSYWDAYELDAVSDLIRLERIRMFTLELAGTNQYYYYGDVDENLVPHGKGLAIYADDTYYFGEWSKGAREGDGMWLRIYYDYSGKEGKATGITEHQYSGTFKNDLPNGPGQEHCSVADDDITNDMTVVNAIGNFKNGYYDGDMYIMTQNRDADRYEWYATANAGTFQYREANKVSTTGKHPVLSKGNDNNHDTDDSDEGYYWMTDEANKGFGIYGLKK